MEDGKKVWWINGRKSYDAVLASGEVWSPNTDNAGRRALRYTRLQQVKKGDVIVCNVKRIIKCLLLVTSEPRSAKRPPDEAYQTWPEQGTTADVEVFQLEPPIIINSSIKSKLGPLQAEGWPFTADMTMDQGYIYEFSFDGLKVLQETANTKWPTWADTSSYNESAKEEAQAEPIVNAPSVTVQHPPTPTPELQRLLELTTYTSNLILYGPPGTGKTWRVRALGKHLAASQPATTTNARAGVGQPLRAWMLITNDDWVLDDGQKWKWADFLTSGTEFFSTRRRFASAFEQASDNDLVFCYRATPVKKLVAVAKVVQQYHEEDEEMGVTIGQISPLTNPIPWATLSSRLQLRSNDVQATFRPLSEEQTAGLVQLCREAGNDLTLPTTEAEEDALLNLTQATEAHSNVEFVTFHQSFAYEDFVEGLKPQIRGGQLDYVVEPGVFRRICTAAEAHPDEHYLLVIDEINRANIAKVFGELITLIEDDKRLTWNPDAGRWEGMRVQLPYSKQQFGVPDNLFLVGTMNTADRSIALLDIALRRRFAFALVPPEPTLLKPLALTEGSLDLSQLLSVLNERVAALLDDDHRIGHSYLMRIGSLAGLRFAWYQRIIPLLEEYFYHDGERLRKVLGGAFVTQTKLSEAAKKALGDLADSSFRRYEVKREMSDADFLGALQRLAANTQVGEGAGEMSED